MKVLFAILYSDHFFNEWCLRFIALCNGHGSYSLSDVTFVQTRMDISSPMTLINHSIMKVTGYGHPSETVDVWRGRITDETSVW